MGAFWDYVFVCVWGRGQAGENENFRLRKECGGEIWIVVVDLEGGG